MIKDVNIDSQFNSEVDCKYLEASQQLQLDKQNYGSDYVEDIEGDWLENWD